MNFHVMFTSHCTMQVGDIVLIERNDHGGNRIPLEYRIPIEDNVYMYRARIITIYPNKPFNRVQPLPSNGVGTPAAFTRKGYKAKTYAIH